MRWLLFAIGCFGCSGNGGGGARPVTTSAPAPSSQASAELAAPRPATEVSCADAATRFDGGAERGAICPAELRAPLVALDLSDAWTPSLFAPGPDGTAPDFRARYLALAAERDADGKPIPPGDALAELYGVVPSLAIVRARLADDARHACHAAIDSAPILTLDKPFGQDHGAEIRGADQVRRALAAQLERARIARKLPDVAALAGVPALAATYKRWKLLDDHHAGLVAAQQHLVCEGFLEARYADGSFTWRTGNAIELFQRRNFLMPNERLDPETREALTIDSRELDFRLALRVLRERVADAAGLIEDGTAGDGPRPILGRMLDPAAMRAARGHEQPLANAAPDLVSPATEVAARALGWLGPAETLAFFRRHPTGARAALALPPAPAYHAAHMPLSAEVDRGDVWYDDTPIPRLIRRRPNLVVYVDDHGTRRPLMRWPTTIGGWADQRLADGTLVQKWKESDVGPRVWRDLFAAPTWLAPKTTPDRELVNNLYNGRWELKSSVFGPGPHAAYGMVLLEHYQVVKLRDGSLRFDDNGIGTHGSASVTSIVHGTSHGCHRLYNQLAVRLADFLLRHRDHLARGQAPERYRRLVSHNGQAFVADIRTRGFLYELTPPVPVDVLRGNVLSARKVPPLSSAAARP